MTAHDIRGSWFHRRSWLCEAHGVASPDASIYSSLRHAVWRGLALFLVVLAFVAMVTPPALAVEEATPAAGAHEEKLTYQELRNSSSQRAQEFFPDAYEEPSFFQWISIPVLIVGLIIALALLGAYLWWQPKFAVERRQKERR